MCSGITGALRHNIKELSVGLGVQLIEYDTVNIEAVLRVGLCRKDLVEAVRRRIHDSLGGGQYFAALTNMRSVGVMGDERTYDYAVALRAVNTVDFMTAEAAHLPWEVLDKVANRIVNEVKHVNRVLYDCTGKPPATIEFE